MNPEDGGSMHLRNVSELHIPADSNIRGVFMLMSDHKDLYNQISQCQAIGNESLWE
jgi:hypothetical protein